MSRWPQLTAPMEGKLVFVEPLAPEHEEGLFAAGHDREMWGYMPSPTPTRVASAFTAGWRRRSYTRESGYYPTRELAQAGLESGAYSR